MMERKTENSSPALEDQSASGSFRAGTGSAGGIPEEMFRLFLDELSLIRRQIESAVEQRNFPFVRRTAQGLKGAAAGLGLARLLQVGKDLERAGEFGDLDKIASALERLRVEVEGLRIELDRGARL